MRMVGISAAIVVAGSLWCAAAEERTRSETAADPAVGKLSQELATRGWIVFTAKSQQGDYDLYVARPDGSHVRPVTRTAAFHEYGGRFSPDGKKILYRRLPKSETLQHDLWGSYGTLMVANADGSNAVAQSKEGEYPWASWGPDGKQIACLYKREGKIRIVDLGSKRVVKEMPRKGVFQQLFWSPDGKQLCGTANVSGQDWNILGIDVASGRSTLLSRELCCTPDWFQASPRVVYSNRRPGLGDGYGWTMLMQGTADGKSRTLVYAEREKHIYFGCSSPDDRYVIFSIMPRDSMVETPMAIVRMSDTPILVEGPQGYGELKALYPGAKPGPVLRLTALPDGFEPHWTYAEIGGAP